MRFNRIPSKQILRHRESWQFRGEHRPEFATEPGPGEESVWDYPRPPSLSPEKRLVRVCLGEQVLAESRHAIRVLETASPPTLYVPPADVRTEALRPSGRESFCEWKGLALDYDLVLGTSLGSEARMNRTPGGQSPIRGMVLP